MKKITATSRISDQCRWCNWKAPLADKVIA
jgi:hypothetical protein